LKNGHCASCGAAAVFVQENGLMFGKFFDGTQLTTGGAAKLDCYVCTECGYAAYYVSDQAGLEHIAEKWAKVPPSAQF
jgi:hypothetical protein